MASLQLRRNKMPRLRRQPRVDEGREGGTRRQASAPPATSRPSPKLRKNHSYPQFVRATTASSGNIRQVGSLMVRCAAPAGGGAGTVGGAGGVTRASHTPAVRAGPPLSCNFCWNTVDECGRILRRKTQYHCPECRTNLCIVPCFHEYHEPDQPRPAASASPSPSAAPSTAATVHAANADSGSRQTVRF